MKIYINVYKKLFLFFLIFVSHDIRSEEGHLEEVDNQDTFEVLLRNMNNKDIANFCALLAKQTVHQITGGRLENNLTSVALSIDEIQDSILSIQEDLRIIKNVLNKVSIVAQLGLICTSAANPALTTTLIVSNYDVDAYNNNIAAALIAVTVAVNDPSITNTRAAQEFLATAVDDMRSIIVDYSSKSVRSMYSLAEIYSALSQLNAQLGYLYILQGS